MATVTLRRSDLYPVGTTVGIYPRGAKNTGNPPRAAVLASASVDAAGLLTVTDAAIPSYTSLHAYALVGGEHRYVNVRSTLDVSDTGQVVGTGDTTSGSATILNASATSGSFQIGQRIAGPGIQNGTWIKNVVGGTLALSDKCTATATGVAINGEGGGLRTQRGRTAARRAAIGTT